MKISLGNVFQSKNERKLLAYFEKNFSRMSNTADEDIFIVGYPKSGNTWFQDLVAGLVFGLRSEKTHLELVNTLVPDVHAHPVYHRLQTPTFFKSHHRPDPQYKNVVYLLRDGRDVMVSYWHHQCALQRKQIDFTDFVQDANLYPCKWHQHVSEWMKNPHNARMLVIKYEDLLAQPVQELERFCVFSGIPVDAQHLEAVAQGASFANLQNRERRMGDNNPAWPKDKPFFRRGIAGSFRDEMPKEVLNLFLKDAAETLTQYGYTL